MRALSTNPRKRRKEMEFYLREKNRWASLPPIIRKWVMSDDSDKVTFISQNPDNVNGKIRRGIEVDYGNLEDMIRDVSIYEEYGLINLRPGQGESNRKGVRLSFMLKEDTEIEKIQSIAPDIKEVDFLDEIMKGNLPDE
tara:strand:+ start:1488 stop:1904 length:417 start_codon:yes stop_codon:yes gene_type:complete